MATTGADDLAIHYHTCQRSRTRAFALTGPLCLVQFVSEFWFLCLDRSSVGGWGLVPEPTDLPPLSR